MLSQAQLGDLLFVSPRAVGKWERSESLSDLITFSRLAEILEVDRQSVRTGSKLERDSTMSRVYA